MNTNVSIDAAILAALNNTDPDAPPVTIRAAWRDLKCNGSGPEVYRRVRYPGSDHEEWPDAPRLPARGVRSDARHAATYCEVPPGTIVVEYARERYHGTGGRCSVSIGVVYVDNVGKGRIEYFPHRTLRSRPAYQCALPNGRVIEVERRERT